jgi:hypothetical protein
MHAKSLKYGIRRPAESVLLKVYSSRIPTAVPNRHSHLKHATNNKVRKVNWPMES